MKSPPLAASARRQSPAVKDRDRPCIAASRSGTRIRRARHPLGYPGRGAIMGARTSRISWEGRLLLASPDLIRQRAGTDATDVAFEPVALVGVHPQGGITQFTRPGGHDVATGQALTH